MQDQAIEESRSLMDRAAEKIEHGGDCCADDLRVICSRTLIVCAILVYQQEKWSKNGGEVCK